MYFTDEPFIHIFMSKGLYYFFFTLQKYRISRQSQTISEKKTWKSVQGVKKEATLQVLLRGFHFVGSECEGITCE
jgi:hypothetical protein